MERLHNMESAEKESKKMRGKERIGGKEHVKRRNG